MNTSHILIGNSSSGIIEFASFKIPVLNVGNRQKRFSVNNVINCKFSEIDLRKKLKTALSEKFNKSIVKIKNPYFKINTSKKIINKILNLS